MTQEEFLTEIIERYEKVKEEREKALSDASRENHEMQ